MSNCLSPLEGFTHESLLVCLQANILSTEMTERFLCSMNTIDVTLLHSYTFIADTHFKHKRAGEFINKE